MKTINLQVITTLYPDSRSRNTEISLSIRNWSLIQFLNPKIDIDYIFRKFDYNSNKIENKAVSSVYAYGIFVSITDFISWFIETIEY